VEISPSDNQLPHHISIPMERAVCTEKGARHLIHCGALVDISIFLELKMGIRAREAEGGGEGEGVREREKRLREGERERERA